MADLVAATGVSRHGIYSDVGGKHDLYLLAFGAYQDQVVSPAFEPVEADEATLADIAAYFETQIALAEHVGLPGPGCFVANAMTETAPHDEAVARQVALHNARLTAGFYKTLRQTGPHLGDTEVQQLADFLTVSAQGLWSMSRVVKTAAPMRAHVTTLMDLLKGKLAP